MEPNIIIILVSTTIVFAGAAIIGIWEIYQERRLRKKIDDIQAEIQKEDYEYSDLDDFLDQIEDDTWRR